MAGTSIPKRLGRMGFTLVELLVVIAIIAILAGFILPALMASQRMARETDCMARLKEFGNAIALYQTDYDKYYPYWLSSMLKTEIGNQKEMYKCPLDKTLGTQGGRPDWITSASQYAETNDMDATLPANTTGGFTTYDLAQLTGVDYYGKFSISARPTENSRDKDVQACSYLYEFSQELCSWYGASYPGLGLNSTWQQVKMYEAGSKTSDVDNNTVTGSKVPIIRCFWHLEDIASGQLQDTRPEHQHVVNLRVPFAVNKSPTDRWWIEK